MVKLLSHQEEETPLEFTSSKMSDYSRRTGDGFNGESIVPSKIPEKGKKKSQNWNKFSHSHRTVKKIKLLSEQYNTEYPN